MSDDLDGVPVWTRTHDVGLWPLRLGFLADACPILTQLSHTAVAAHDLKIEWTHDDGIAHNWQHIVRQQTRFTKTGKDEPTAAQMQETQAKAFRSMCETAEKVLIYSEPIAAGMYRTMGGIRHWLGREQLEPGDDVILRPLRDPFLMEELISLESDFGPDGWVYRADFIFETSLQVNNARTVATVT